MMWVWSLLMFTAGFAIGGITVLAILAVLEDWHRGDPTPQDKEYARAHRF